eukprot:GHVR01178414.1.p1 GENE.GHVR01178414.1~~GHVR01178414.1.p1  ORF type:complete len:336 (-),score=78.54 GHVR01178414.1:326-1300(-)
MTSKKSKEYHTQLIEKAVTDIDSAEFVAFDCEFSGLFSSFDKEVTLQGHWDLCRESIPNFLTIQFGICTARRDPVEHCNWVLSPHNFYVYPSERRNFMSDTKTLQWLLKQGFDFSRWLEEGLSYAPLSLLKDPECAGSVRRHGENISLCGIQRLIERVIEKDKPLVGHHCILDLIHIHDKFIGIVPEDLYEFASELRRLFPSGLFDTKLIAGESRTKVFHLADRSGTALEALRDHLMSGHKGSCVFSLSDNACEYSLEPGESSQSHEAGYDALMCAEVFILELLALQRHTLANLSTTAIAILNRNIDTHTHTHTHTAKKFRKFP